MNAQMIHKIDLGTTQAEKQVKKVKSKVKKTLNSWKFKVGAILIGIAISLFIVWSTFYSIYSWSEVHKLVFKPILTYQIRIPFKDYKVIVDREVLSPISKVEKLSEAELLAADKVRKQKEREAFIERLYQATRFLESRVGFDEGDSTATHTYCQSIGMVNEVGYFPEGNRKFCFKDEPEQRLTLTRWFTKKLDGMTAQEALCLYVTGVRQPTCKRVMEVGL